MRKNHLVGIIAAFLLICACNNNNNQNSSTESHNDTNSNANLSSGTDNSAANAGIDTTASNSSPGLALMKSSNCLTCHKIDQKVIGPAYTEVADKYAGNDTAVNYLAHKIINGGSGVWGEVAMPPHPELSLPQAKEMVNYILSLNR